MDIPFSSIHYLFIDGLLGYFQYLVIFNKSAMDIHIYVLVCFHFFLGIDTYDGMAETYSWFLFFKKIAKFFPKAIV